MLWLCWVTRTPLPAAVAVLSSVPYLRRLRSPWHTTAPALSTYLALGWWSACVMFDLLMAPAALAVRAGMPMGATWGVAGTIVLVLGTDAFASGGGRVEGLPPELDGYRIGQIFDVHCGPHVSEERVSSWVSRLNALDLDLVTVTGDLITHGRLARGST